MSHSHSNHGHADHDHEHPDELTPALQTLIWKQIDFESIRTLNESEPDAGAKIVEKTWPQRLNPEPELVSDADEQLLIFVPFAGALKLHSILIRSSTSASAPKTLKLFANNDSLDFSSAGDVAPTQTLELSQTNDIQEIPVKRALFGNTYNLNLFVEDNYGEEATRIWYLGFKGEFMNLSRWVVRAFGRVLEAVKLTQRIFGREPVEVLYEKAANPKDHAPIVGVGDMAAQGSRHGM